MFPDGSGELTTKHTDGKSIRNRVEIDVPVSDVKQALAFWTYQFGKPIGKIVKVYTVFLLDKNGTTISVYKLSGHKTVFLEVEAHSEKTVNYLLKKMAKVLTFKVSDKSLYGTLFKKGRK
jgi:hypothetical protein